MFLYVSGCTRSMVTFFKYDSRRRQLIPLRIMCAGDPVDKPKLISFLNLSKDEISRYVAVAILSLRSCTLKVWRIEYLPEDSRQRHNNNCQIDSDVNVNVTITFRDRYSTKVPHDLRRVIKVREWIYETNQVRLNTWFNRWSTIYNYLLNIFGLFLFR